MKLFSTFILISFLGLSAMAQPADGVIYEPQNLPLNNDGTADAYSWLSKDGLRIYYTRDNSEDEIWKAERKSLSEEFKNPVAISINGIGSGNDVFSCWLSADEKTLFFVTHQGENGFATSLYKSPYDEVSKEFINPIKINLSGGGISESSSIFISGPSLTPDLKQLFVYYNDEHSDERIACFTTIDGINYTFKSFVNDGKNYCPGSLAHDGLSFYLTLRDESNILVKLSRPNLNTDFGNPEYFIIDSSINSGKNYYQPHVNAEMGIMTLTYGVGTWQSNDLAIIKIPTERTVYIEKIELAVNEIDSAVSVEVTDDGSETLIQTVQIDTVLTFENWVLSFEEGDSANVIHDYLPAANCTFGYEESKVVFLGETSSDDTLSFDPDFEFIIPVSNNHTSYFNAMPNPASSSFRIMYDIKTNSAERPIFEMTNLNGQIVKRFELQNTSGNFEIDIIGLAEGLYLYKIITSDFVGPVKKLVVKR